MILLGRAELARAACRALPVSHLCGLSLWLDLKAVDLATEGFGEQKELVSPVVDHNFVCV